MATQKAATTSKTTTTKSTGAAAKVARQSKSSPVRNDASQQQPKEQPVNTQQQTANTIDQNEMRDVVAAAAAAGAAAEERAVTEQIRIADLKAQKRALDEQIKAAKATQPTQLKPEKPIKTLHDVVARQAETIGIGHVLYVAQRAMTRVKMGQDAAQAVNAVAAREAEAAVGALELMATGDYPDLRSALMQWCAVHAPLTVVKQRTQVSDGSDE